MKSDAAKEERRFEFGYRNEYDKLQSVMIHIPRRNELEYHDAKRAMYKSIPNYEKLLEEVDAYRSKLIELGIHVCDDLYFHETEYNPFPNQLYMRDLAVITPDSVILANPKYDKWPVGN